MILTIIPTQITKKQDFRKTCNINKKVSHSDSYYKNKLVNFLQKNGYRFTSFIVLNAIILHMGVSVLLHNKVIKVLGCSLQLEQNFLLKKTLNHAFGFFIKRRKVSKLVRKYSKGKIRFKTNLISIRGRSTLGHLVRFSKLIQLNSDCGRNNKQVLDSEAGSKRLGLMSLMYQTFLDFTFNKNLPINNAQTTMLQSYLKNGCRF